MPTFAQSQRKAISTPSSTTRPAQALLSSHQATAQRTSRLRYSLADIPIAAPKKNTTDLPDRLKTGIEQLSGLSLDDVSVHYNSSEPSAVQALAYTRGTHIHLGPGQERHLAHEAWHVVQQKQGRVKPTLEVGGMKANDDTALEREADMLGGKASRSQDAPQSATIADALPIQQQQSDGGQVAQMKYGITASAKDQKALNAISSDPLWQHLDLKWVANLREIYDYIDELKKVLDDDNDVLDLEKDEKRIDNLARELDKLTKGFAAREQYPPTRTRSAKRRSAKRAKVQGKPTAGGQPLSQREIAEKIDEKAIELGKLFKNLKVEFALSEGGFSAKARAHDIEVSETPKLGHAAETAWFGDITLDATAMNKTVYKKSKKVSDPANIAVVSTKIHSLKTRDAKLAKFESLVETLKLKHTPPPFTRAPAAKDRGAGQLANMATVSATGYAKVAQIPGWKTSRWEWLHIRAASLGGATDGSNLVVGTRDANTHMMPFEANVRALANIVKDDKDYKELRVEFSASGQHSKAKHQVKQISIAWKMVKNPAVKYKVEEPHGVAKFNPLNAAASISKTEVDILEKTLKERRDKITG